MARWEYMTVYNYPTDFGWRVRFVNNEELDNWELGPNLSEYLREWGDQEWEVVTYFPFTRSTKVVGEAPTAAGPGYKEIHTHAVSFFMLLKRQKP